MLRHNVFSKPFAGASAKCCIATDQGWRNALSTAAWPQLFQAEVKQKGAILTEAEITAHNSKLNLRSWKFRNQVMCHQPTSYMLKCHEQRCIEKTVCSKLVVFLSKCDSSSRQSWECSINRNSVWLHLAATSQRWTWEGSTNHSRNLGHIESEDTVLRWKIVYS